MRLLTWGLVMLVTSVALNEAKAERVISLDLFGFTSQIRRTEQLFDDTYYKREDIWPLGGFGNAFLTRQGDKLNANILLSNQWQVPESGLYTELSLYLNAFQPYAFFIETSTLARVYQQGSLLFEGTSTASTMGGGTFARVRAPNNDAFLFDEVQFEVMFVNMPEGVAWDMPGLFLEMAYVPEPSTCVMALAGLACGGYTMFRRRKRA
jgi:hypothetical protein